MSDQIPDHIDKPHLRPIQPIPLQKDGKQFVALRDPSMLQDQTMVVPVQALPILQQFHGERTLEQLAGQFKTQPAQLMELARGLDKLGLLWGPTFEKLEADRWEELKTSGAFPARAASSLGSDEDACRSAIDEFFAQTEDPELEEQALAIVAPHLDYERGWPNYAAAYYALRNLDPPDRVVILGTNHFGLGDGVVLSEFGFDSPLGRCPADDAVVTALVERLGRPLIVDQLDHLPEHSIELHVPWIQYCWGDVPIVAALIPDPLSSMIADDDGRVTHDQFVGALGEALDGAGGRTFFIASSDLSHVGPQFGEPRPVDEQRRIDVERHDREMMSKYLTGDPEEFLGAMRWNKNPTRWCSIGNMAALLSLVRPEAVELIDYRQAFDEKGMALVSSAAMTLV
ncbi:MAG: AmmeMemoRadiSam system protein B [Planctomycetes bacterium]|nr:AmmeMemoRadiSam system protein B [Planctomycetota bacterium]